MNMIESIDYNCLKESGDLFPTYKNARKDEICDQIRKIREELNEVEDAYDKYKVCMNRENRDNVAEETVDVQSACETLLFMLGMMKEERDAMRTKVYLKNKKRGYYEVEEDK